MATVKDVRTRAQAEAPSCCGRLMTVEEAPGIHSPGEVAYRCSNCLRKQKGRRGDDIAREIDKGTLQPVTQQGSQVMSQATFDREHNTAVLKRLLIDISGMLHRGTDTINALNRRNGNLVGQVADAGEFAVATEQTDKSKQALDETAAVTATMDQHLGGMSTAVTTAEDAVSAAISGLRVVDEAEDQLTQAGAGPKSVAPARDGA
jgi:hypothetical protein